MQLVLNDEIVSEDPDDGLIERALRGMDPDREDYVILSTADEWTYIQAQMLRDEKHVWDPYSDQFVEVEGDVDILLEYQDGSIERHYFCVEDIDIQRLTQIFIHYLHSDEQWKTQLEWEHLPL